MCCNPGRFDKEFYKKYFPWMGLLRGLESEGSQIVRFPNLDSPIPLILPQVVPWLLLPWLISVQICPLNSGKVMGAGVLKMAPFFFVCQEIHFKICLICISTIEVGPTWENTIMCITVRKDWDFLTPYWLFTWVLTMYQAVFFWLEI